MKKRATVVFLASLAGPAAGEREAHAAGPPASVAPQAVAELARLRTEELAVAARYDVVLESRRRLLHLLAALECSKRTGSAEDAADVAKSIAAYKAACAAAKTPVEPAELDSAATTALSSIDGLIAKVKDADVALSTRVTAAQDERRTVNRLITALEEYARAASPRNVAALAKARELYGKARA